jgi:hypothetical protein
MRASPLERLLLGFFELGFFELGFFELGFFELGFFELGFFELGFFELGFFELGWVLLLISIRVVPDFRGEYTKFLESRELRKICRVVSCAVRSCSASVAPITMIVPMILLLFVLMFLWYCP